MKLWKPITTCLLFVWLGLTAVAQKGPGRGRALLLTDVHLDPLADPAIIKQLIAAPVAQWSAIFQSSKQKSFSMYGADTNYQLFSSTLEKIAAQEPFDYAVFTGDALRHNFAQAFVAAGGTPDQFPEFAAKTEGFVVQALQDRLKVPVVVALGNDDSPCGDYQGPPNSPFLAALSDRLTVLANSPEAKSTFQLGGYYSMAHPTVTNEDVIVLNTVLWSTLYKSCAQSSGDPGEAELDWLGWKLYTASLLHRNVALVMHIPPGMDAYSSSHGQCQNPVPFWQDKYQTRFSALMSRYSNVVEVALAGHVHMDDFRVTGDGSASLPLRITPSVTPIYKNNPAFSVMSYDLKTASVFDITTYFLALSSQPPVWAKEYQFSRAYDIDSFSAGNLSKIAATIRSGGAARTTFETDYAASAPSPIDPSNFLYYSCAHTHFGSTSYSKCVCSAATSMPQR